MVDLRRRDAALTERMDDPDCDTELLRRTYRRFDVVNRLVAGWQRTYRVHVRPRLQAAQSRGRVPRLLDVGCGAGDVTRALERWALRDGLQVAVTGVDPDAVAIGEASNAASHSGSRARFLRVRAGDIDEEFDIVVSNHVLHHINDLPAFLHETAGCCASGGLLVHSDIERSLFAYAAFSALALPLTRGNLIREDGLLSIRRSYTASELRVVVPTPWHVTTQSPSRVLLRREMPRA
ncbi:methyltransferase domain-containing protein [Paramicrobacterium chengjingii]|uniref:Methyltransferase domain-containing protein n=1 Tax=Paramicrobacterium chengjingii TaxID=2769067 RepID=A0ABX6YKS8_9MICO|nr:methyltransferase domain-containing protein [Microbacterium chengjingii]QPZ38942.1 methyltransferase domain-containing protein [Microbacterium chengjingii]